MWGSDTYTRVSAAEPAAPAPCDSAASPPTAGPPSAPADPAAPTDTINHPAPEVPKVDAEFTKARFGEYIRKSGEEEGKAKNSSI